MSGGFFRGTSADQDTRFSNKQAKLLKSQKFPPELEHLVDMTKVKMDVIRPWIASRATELLGFEDEVLINFIYGLLDVKLVDGKKIQIQLTGFMEKNTGKFMKELWCLLLSAQNNVSGVPQPFLDAKEEETRKKKAETDRIASEIQKRREPERVRKSGFEGEADVFRSVNAAPESVPRHSRGRSSSIPREEEREANMRQGSRAINGRSRSPQRNDRSPSPYRSTTSPTRSTKKTIARSRSHSREEPKSRSVSVSSQSQGRSVSPERQYASPARRPLSPERRYRSPRRSSSPRRRLAPLNTESSLRPRSPHLKRRSTSRSRHRSPPYRQRSPRARQRSPPSPRRRSPSLSRRRIPSPLRRGSQSPLRRRSPLPLRPRSPSPLRRRSPSPLRHRSRTPLRRRSPSPRRRRSPVKARRRSPSPLRHRSPIRRRSPLPWRRSPLRRSPNHRRRSPVRSPINHPMDPHSSPRQRKRGHSPYRSRSPFYRTRRSLSKERDGRLDGHSSRRHRDEHDSQRTHEQNSPVNHDLDREIAEHAGPGEKASEIVSRKVPVSLRSPQRDVGNQNDHHDKVAAAITEDSPSQSDSPANTKKLNSRITRRFRSLSKSPVRQTRAKMPRHDNPGNSREEKETSRAREVLRHAIDSSGKRSDNSQRDAGLKRSYIDDHGPESNSPDRVSPTQSPAARGRPVNSKKSSGHRSDVDLPERHSQRVSYSSDANGFDPKSVRGESGSPGDVHDRQRSAKHHPKDAPVLEEKAHNEKTDGYGVNDGKRPHQSKERREPHQELESIKQKVDKSIRRDSKDSDSEKTGSDKHHMEKRGHRRSDKRKRDSDESSESDSQMDDRKEAKRKRKDEKRLRKEEKRRRREEKHRKRLERRAKQKVKSVDTVTPPSDFKGNDNDSDNSDVDANMRKKFHPSDADEIESEQKKLEIELRKKALESLRAKKAISH